MTFKYILLPLVAACVISACSKSEAPRASATEVTEVALADVPQTVNAVVSAARAEFTAKEVLKKVRDGRVYYDVEGELPNGDEIEFDVLMTESGPEIVEIQRDLNWGDVPLNAKAEVAKGNVEGLEVVRLIRDLKCVLKIM